MKLSLPLALSLASALVAVAMAYADLRAEQRACQSFRTEESRKVERMQMMLANVRAWQNEMTREK